MTDYEPQAGDIVWTEFDPSLGREQRGRRPSLVLSPLDFFRASRFVIVCPITSRVRPFASSVVLPTGLAVSGEILTSHVRSIDTISRPILPAGCSAPDASLQEVRAKLALLIGAN